MKKRTALVTGSSRGIGREIAFRLAQDGFNIVINYKDHEKEANQTAEEIAKTTGVIVVRADVSKSADVDKLFAESKKVFGFVDTVVCNAGISKFGLLIDETEASFDEIIGTNLKGAFLVSKRFLPDMLSRQFGRIINISSIWGTAGGSNESLYSASKAGLIGLSKALSKEAAPNGVSVNVVAPGAINHTAMTDVLPESIKNLIVSGTMAGRMGEPKDVAAAVSFFAREDTGFITGQVLTVSGDYIGLTPDSL
jgi:3-oxoacyl-[acyl-carrier protein] reductase